MRRAGNGHFALIAFILAVAVALSASCAFSPGPAFGEGGLVESGRPNGKRPGGASSIGDLYDGEELIYTIGFWVFDDVAVGKMGLRKLEDGVYEATLDARTTGFVQKIITSRSDTYRSRLKLSEDGGRFITVSFEKSVEVGGKLRMSRSELDYTRRVINWKTWGEGREEKSGEIPIPEGVYSDDPLAAFYNLRYGVYGPIEEGREFKIHTLPKAGKVPDIGVKVASKGELMARMSDGKATADYLVYVRIDPELFASAGTEILFTSDLVPVEAVAKDVALFGDVRGKLREIGVRMNAKKTAEAPKADGKGEGR